MITITVHDFNHISQDFYDSVIEDLQLHQLECSCKRSGCLSIHGYYTRVYRDPEQSFRLRVCRVICSECGKTHALLLSPIVPYSQIPLETQRQVAEAADNGSSMDPVLESNPFIDENNIKHIVSNYRRHWKERLRSAGLALTNAAALVSRCFLYYSAQFMQIHRGFNSLFPLTT